MAPSASGRPRSWPEKRTTNDEETLFWLSCPCNALHLETPSCTIFKTHLAPPLLAGLLLLLLLPPDLLLLLGGDLLRGLGDLLPLHHHDHNDHRQMKFNPTCHPGILSLEDFFLPCKETSFDLRSCMIQFFSCVILPLYYVNRSAKMNHKKPAPASSPGRRPPPGSSWHQHWRC